MLTWILLAIIVAALLGYINVDKVRAKLIEYYHQAMPHVKKAVDEIKTKAAENNHNSDNNENNENK
ncbi:MAG: hypothetical protein KHX55_05645 [Proteobacteria bacterium]|nr:hypothetical protein [Pseudomonadota bacterium]